MANTIHVAQKPHKCDSCFRRIPKGAKYWRDYVPGELPYMPPVRDRKEHTNCLEYAKEPFMEEGHD